MVRKQAAPPKRFGDRYTIWDEFPILPTLFFMIPLVVLITYIVLGFGFRRFAYADTEKIKDSTFAEWQGSDGSGEWKNGGSENK